MADHQAAHDRDAERHQQLLGDLFQVEAVALDRDLGELAEHDAGQFLQLPGQQQVGQHPVDPVPGLVDVLQEQDRAVQVRRVGRADQRAEQAQVAADQAAAGAPADEGGDAVLALGAAARIVGRGRRRDHGRRLRFLDHLAVLGQRVLGKRRRGAGAVEADQAGARMQAEQQAGDVAVADDDLRVLRDRFVVEPGQRAHRAVAAAQREDRLHVRVGEHRVEVRGALPVGSGQVLGAGVDVLALLDPVAERAQHVDRVADFLAVARGAGRRHQPDGHAGRQPRRLDDRPRFGFFARRGDGRARGQGGGRQGSAGQGFHQVSSLHLSFSFHAGPPVAARAFIRSIRAVRGRCAGSRAPVRAPA